MGRNLVDSDSVVFYVPKGIAEDVVTAIRERPIEHPNRPGIMSKTVVTLSYPAHLKDQPVKVWFPI